MPSADGNGPETPIKVRAGLQTGLTLVFMRRPCFDMLERWSMTTQRQSIISIQKIGRGTVWRRRFKLWKVMCIKLQCRIRTFIAIRRKLKLRRRKAGRFMIRVGRGMLARKLVRHQFRMTLRLQCSLRCALARRQLLSHRRNFHATKLAAFMRMYVSIP